MNKYGPVKHLLFLLKRSIIKNDIYLKIAAYLDMLQISHQPVENGLGKPIFEGCRITQAEELREKIRSYMLVTGWGYWAVRLWIDPNISWLEITKKKYLAPKMKFESQIGTKTVYQPLSFYLINFYLIGSQQMGRCAMTTWQSSNISNNKFHV